MFGLGAGELLLILLALLLLFGATKLPKLARALGQSGKEVREGFSSPEQVDEEAAPH